ncbi:MAG: NAD-dependent DNA ligase LigA [Anaerovoracaceae bacterium]
MDKNEKQSKIEQMQNLIVLLNQASRAYYQESREIMPNHEYDRLYDLLESLEKETGVTLSKSPTMRVGYEVLSDLPKEKHPQKMLSLDKTKDVEQLKSWLGSQEGVLSWKLDGLTIVLTYEEGKLVKAVTRGNGEIGEVITTNARAFSNLPLGIPFKERLVLRGEAVISYPDFEKINETIADEGAKYKNPRNLCSGSVRQLNSAVTAERHVRFYAFALVSADGMEFSERTEQFDWLAQQGFAVVQHKKVTSSDLEVTVQWFEGEIEENINPSDGLVLSYNDIAYGQSLGTTAKFPRDSIAFKWRDEIRETTLKEIEWSASRTGLINPVAIFEPVELEGTTVSRASVHNISVMRELRLGIGDTIKVYKANMIIPQIAENLTGSNSVEIPAECPVCGSHTEIHDENGVQTLMCPNPECLAKQIKSFTHFVSRDAMNIEGLSEMTIEKLIARGLIKELADLFHVEKYKDEIVEMEGFGEKSFANLCDSIEKARNTTVQRFLYSLGIPNIGTANARIIAQHCRNSWQKVQNLSKEELMTIDGIGEVMADAYVGFFADPTKAHIVEDLLKEVHLDEEFETVGTALEGMTFVITGSLNHYENREALKAEIEKQGGKVAGSVSAKTSCLINNDLLSQSGKNKKAKELGIKIIDEETIMKWLETGVTE